MASTRYVTEIYLFLSCHNAGVALVISLALLPVSFESKFMSQFCGPEASYYYRGMCTVDWGLYVAMVITACALYLPSLAIFAMNISDGLRANVCC